MDAVELSYLDALSETAREQQMQVVRAREYYAGSQKVPMGRRQKQYLDTNPPFKLNIIRSLVNAVRERMLISGFTTDEPGEVRKPWAQWTTEVWQRNRMDAVQEMVHEWTLRDGEAFVIVDFDGELPRFHVNPVYVDTNAGGDGFGCQMIYRNGDPNQEPLYAVKQWTETINKPKRHSRQRRTLYFPDRIERYVMAEGGWQPYTEDGEAWPIAWVDNRGRPLGIAAIHFTNPGSRPEAWDALPLQDAINKSLIDLMGAADSSAFQILVALGFMPTTDGKPPLPDGSNWLTLEPGQLIGTTQSKADADVKALPAGDITQLQELVQGLMHWTATITETPLSRFVASAQVAAEGTLKQQEEPLIAKVRLRQVLFGNAWEDTLALAARLQSAFDQSPNGAIDPYGVLFYSQWANPVTRVDMARNEELKIKRDLGVPLEVIWAELGYSGEQIAEMKKSPEYLARLAQLDMTTTMGALDDGG